MSGDASTVPACPCGTVAFPAVICNSANLPAIAYRIGDYVAFRHRLLQALPGETALTGWQPGAEGDLAVQMMEWWAYLGDILTFYNERIANEAYLGTALLPESVNHLVRLLGYRPRPALGARVTLAGLLSNKARLPVALAPGLLVQSKPGPGQKPQVFELDAAASLLAPDFCTAVARPAAAPLLGPDGGLWLAGKVTGIKAGDRLLLVNAGALTAQTLANYCWIKVVGTAPATDPLGNAVTAVSFSTISGALSAGAAAADYVLLRAAQSGPLWSFPAAQGVLNTNATAGTTTADLASIARGLAPGALVLFDLADSAAATLAASLAAALQTAATNLQNAPTDPGAARGLAAAAIAAGGAALTQAAEQAFRELVYAQRNLIPISTAIAAATAAAAQGTAAAAALTTATLVAAGLMPLPAIIGGYTEVIWYANGAGGDATMPPAANAANPVPAITIPHTEITVPALNGPYWPAAAAQVTLRWGWTSVGQLAPVLTAADLAFGGGAAVLAPTADSAAFPAAAVPVLLEDGALNSVSAVLTPVGDGTATSGQVSALPAGGLASPISVLFNLLAFSRGKTVPAETLGSGNPAVAGQDFALAKSPVTYFADPASVSGNGFSSTMRLSVSGVQWREVQSFYGQAPTAQVFVLYEDDAGATHVSFGDGVNGARLPTGVNNVTATYRYGACAAAPAVETLTVVQTPTPGLQGLRNPLAPTGGADPDAPAKLASLAPASVLTFNRAVALDDYAVIAGTAAGVTQAVAAYAFDPVAQRPVVTLWIAGDANAVTQAGQALAGVAMPNQGLRIKPATPIEAVLSLTYVRDPRYDDATVQAALTTALVDPDLGLLGGNVQMIGGAVYQSRIAQTCLAVAGVKAIHGVALAPIVLAYARVPRWRGRAASNMPAAAAACGGMRYDPGPGNYFYLPDDGQHLTLSGTTAS